MALKNLFKSDRCNKCKIHNGYRFCIKLGKKICWECCNDIRDNYKCPETCKYHIREDAINGVKINADSQTEFTDLSKKIIRNSLRKPQEALGNKIPLELKYDDKGKIELQKFISTFPDNPIVSKNFIRKELNIPEFSTEKEIVNPENIAKNFLDSLIEQNWENVISHLSAKNNYDNDTIKENFISRMLSHKQIKKIQTYELIKSGMNENRKELLVQFEINRKFFMTIHLLNKLDDWLVKTFYFEAAEFHLSEENFSATIAGFISKNQLGNAEDTILKALKIFPNSADFYYYYGLIFSLRENRKKAKKNFFTAIEIDPYFDEAIYNYAFLLHAEDNKEKAKELYLKVLSINKEHLKSINNLAVLYEEEGNLDKAIEMFNKCLEINAEFDFAQKNIERINEKRNK